MLRLLQLHRHGDSGRGQESPATKGTNSRLKGQRRDDDNGMEVGRVDLTQGSELGALGAQGTGRSAAILVMALAMLLPTTTL